MNFAIHLPQVGRMTEGSSNVRDVRSADYFTKQLEKNSSFNTHFFNANTDPIAGGYLNTQFMARSDLNWTDFIYVPKEDIINLRKTVLKGGRTDVDGKTIVTSEGRYVLQGIYRNGTTPCPINGGKLNGVPTNSPDPKTYFYKGFDSADCIDFLDELGII